MCYKKPMSESKRRPADILRDWANRLLMCAMIAMTAAACAQCARRSLNWLHRDAPAKYEELSKAVRRAVPVEVSFTVRYR